MKVKELLTDESKWIKEWFAMSERGRYVPPNSRLACKWCLRGAIRRCYEVVDNLYTDNVVDVEQKVVNVIGMSIPKWNDAPERTFADVKKLVEELDI